MSSRRGPETNCKRCLHRREGKKKKTRTPNRCQNKVALRYTYISLYRYTLVHTYIYTYVTPSNDITIIIIYYWTYDVLFSFTDLSPRSHPPAYPATAIYPFPAALLPDIGNPRLGNDIIIIKLSYYRTSCMHGASANTRVD